MSVHPAIAKHVVPAVLAGYVLDIPRDLANQAHYGTSQVPETRGGQMVAEYCRTLLSDYNRLSEYAKDPDALNTLATEFGRYREGYRSRYMAWLQARSRCISTLVTGGSNFPGRRNAKRNNIADKRCIELTEYRVRALSAIEKALRPELRPIMAGDSDAVSRLWAKLDTLTSLRSKMRAANNAIRKHAKAGESAQIDALIALGFTAAQSGDLLQPSTFGYIGFAPYQITNASANIRNLKARIRILEAAHATPDTETVGPHARIEDSPSDNRVRLFYPGKPSDITRSALKSAGFRWAPSLGCWQAYRNTETLRSALGFAGVK